MGSVSGAGLGSRTVAFRFRVGAEGRLDEAAAGAAVAVEAADDDSEEFAACLADERVILGVNEEDVEEMEVAVEERAGGLDISGSVVSINVDSCGPLK